MTMTRQEIFDKVATHLLTQNKKSIVGSICLYRGPDNTKCAIGCLIPDEMYDEAMESKGIITLFREEYFEIMDLLGGVENEEFLHDLQGIHDEHEPDEWKNLLRKFADNSDHVLAYPTILQEDI